MINYFNITETEKYSDVLRFLPCVGFLVLQPNIPRTQISSYCFHSESLIADTYYWIILPTQCNALIRLCLPPSQKRVKLFYIVFPLPHGGITVCTRQYPYPTTYLLDTFQSVPACGIFHIGWWTGDGGGNHSVHCIVVSKIILIIRS